MSIGTRNVLFVSVFFIFSKPFDNSVENNRSIYFSLFLKICKHRFFLFKYYYDFLVRLIFFDFSECSYHFFVYFRIRSFTSISISRVNTSSFSLFIYKLFNIFIYPSSDAFNNTSSS